MENREALGMFFRYFLLLLLPSGGLWLFYTIFTPATVYPVFWVLKEWVGAQMLLGNVIFIKGYYAEIIGACVAGAAYYFLIILNLSTPMHIAKRIKSITYMFSIFLFLNIMRIIIFSKLFSVGYAYFDLTHELVWYFGSTVLVVLVWFSNVFLFKISSIPIYTDICTLLNTINNKENDKP